MLKWVKIFGNQYVGFWVLGLVLFFIVVLPPLYYVFIGLWRNNIILTVTGCIFLVVHFTHVSGNLRMG